MTCDFYLFNVEHGQAAALRTPLGEWCLFDAGSSSSFSPIAWIGEQQRGVASPLLRNILQPIASLAKVTISHLHGDHLSDCPNLLRSSIKSIRTVYPDNGYWTDLASTMGGVIAGQNARMFIMKYGMMARIFGCSRSYSFGPVNIRERQLNVNEARAIGGDANSRVNNASVVTRVECYGNSILICGDMMTEGWKYLLSYSRDRISWSAFIRGVDILVAPHHGHSSGYSSQMMTLANPQVVLASMRTGDLSVDNRYSLVQGIMLGGKSYKCITTRKYGHLRIAFSQPRVIGIKGTQTWWLNTP